MILDSYMKNETVPVSVTHFSYSKTDYHNHSFLEFVYVVSGSSLHIRNGKTEHIYAGNFFIIDYSTYHQYISDNNIEVINLMFTPQFIDNTLANCNNFKDLLNNYLIKFNVSSLTTDPTEYTFYDEDDKIKKIFTELEREHSEQKHGFYEIMRSNIVKLIILTLRKIDLLNPTELSPEIQKIKNIIEANYSDALTLMSLCNEIHYSLPHISRKFKTEVGVNFNKYLTEIRMKEACRLIANTGKKISEIANLTGYSDIKHFQYTFKKITGNSPQEFRRNIKSINYNEVQK